LKEAGLVAEQREGTKRIYELSPRGWESYLDGGPGEQASYTSGWDTVLGHFTAYLEA
jgi:DNA-binding PadR family transcriptional regulator